MKPARGWTESNLTLLTDGPVVLAERLRTKAASFPSRGAKSREIARERVARVWCRGNGMTRPATAEMAGVEEASIITEGPCICWNAPCRRIRRAPAVTGRDKATG